MEEADEFVEQRLGTTLCQRWTLNSVLGVGGMAAVYAATEPSGTEVALKVLHPEFGRKSTIKDRFFREAAVAERLNHPGAVHVMEHGEDDNAVFLVMERLRGESLEELLERDGTMAPAELLNLMDQVLQVLEVAHAAGVVHRDLKPANLFITQDQRVKVLDFGVARVLDDAPDDVKTRTGVAIGTLSYMAPEQALGKRAEIDGRVDIFALGVTAFRILSNRRVHEADSEAGMLVAMATKQAPPLSSVAPQVPTNLAAIVDMALAFDRNARYPDAASMRADVQAVQQGQAPPLASQRQRRHADVTRADGLVAPLGAIGDATRADGTAAPNSSAETRIGQPDSAQLAAAARPSDPTRADGFVAQAQSAPIPAISPEPTIAPEATTVSASPAALVTSDATMVSAQAPSPHDPPLAAQPPPSSAKRRLWLLAPVVLLFVGVSAWAAWPAPDSSETSDAIGLDDDVGKEPSSSADESPADGAERDSNAPRPQTPDTEKAPSKPRPPSAPPVAEAPHKDVVPPRIPDETRPGPKQPAPAEDEARPSEPPKRDKKGSDKKPRAKGHGKDKQRKKKDKRSERGFSGKAGRGKHK